MNPAQLQSLLQDAVVHHRANRLAEAEKLYARARAVAPSSFDAWYLAGALLLQRGAYREARPMLERALRLGPESAQCALRLGLACTGAGDLPGAERHLRAAIQRDALMPDAWNHLGFVLRLLGRLDEARGCYERAVAFKPDYIEAHDRLGALLCEQHGHAAGLPHFRRVVELQPDYVPGWSNLGAALVMDGQLTPARDAFDRALSLDSDNEQALTGRALVLERSYQMAEADAAYHAVLRKNPRNHEARSARLLCQHYLSGVTRAQRLAEHRAFAAALPVGRAPAFHQTFEPDRKLRVAMLSADLRNHSVAYFLAPLLRHLDRTQFEIVLYHDHFIFDATSERLRSLADVWRRVGGMPVEALEKIIHADAPDILIDLAGHTGGNRLPLFARKIAPLQMTYLGYPDTTGLTTIDYRLVDAITDPVGEADEFATEQLLRFAPTAWAYAPPASVAEPARPPSAATARVTFGCFNNFAKVSDETLHGWAQVLAAVPGSRLLLKGHGLTDPALQESIRRRLVPLGVGEARVELLGRLPTLEAHLAAYASIDVALDTFPYHGTTTTCEALWMGVPVVTLAGDHHAARVGASLLTAAGHPEWIARDWADYAQIAAALATDTAARTRLRESLRTELRRSALLDHAGQAARFGIALRQAWRKRCEVMSPREHPSLAVVGR